MNINQECLTSARKKSESDNVTTNPARREAGDKTKKECVAATLTHMTGCKPLVLMQVNSRGIYNKTLDFCNLIDTYNQDVVIGMDSWLSEEISIAEFLITQLSEGTHTIAVVKCLLV
jgi:hypothetical protein